jgi:hypothetical protein
LNLDAIHIFFCRFFLIRWFFFFIALLGHTYFILDITFLVIWACPLAFEFLELLCPFFSHGFLSFFIEIFSCPPV